ncbi:hypothetical protein [Cysteiniphilum litorale]|uniref:hypothetical protein n=1 Tax=Cysteiniphilum litorale TaxID=2056700 RepID=UPI003F88088F
MQLNRETIAHVYLLMRQALKINRYIDERITLIEPVWQHDEIYNLMRNEDVKLTNNYCLYANSMRPAFNCMYDIVDNMLNLLESNGVMVFAVPDFLEDKIDSFAFWHYRDCIIFINLSQCRTKRAANIELATQLGHLLLHDDVLGNKIPSIHLNRDDFDASGIFAGYFLGLRSFDYNKQLVFRFNHSRFFERIIELLKAEDGGTQYEIFLNRMGIAQKYHSMVTKLLPSEKIIQFPDVRRKVIVTDHTDKRPIPNNLIEFAVKKTRKAKEVEK